MVRKTFTTEDFGVKTPTTTLESNEVIRSRDIINSTLKYENNVYEVGLLWKADDVKLTNNKEMAFKRLRCVERKMERDDEYAKVYINKIQEYVNKGYAIQVSPEEQNKQSDRIWYLPHFGVVNQNKPGKFRLVFDAAAKYQDVSLNDVLMKGPDTYTLLIGVLFKFRQRKIAVCADIGEMFHRINIIDDDTDAQRFLWRGGDVNNSPQEYKMKAMIFGASCSPSLAQEVKNINAMKHIQEYPVAVNAIIKKHYVDDYLDSYDDEATAIEIALQVKQIHLKGNFELKNWLSNSEIVLNSLESDRDINVKNMNFDEKAIQGRVLGVYWDASADEFLFKIKFNNVCDDIIKFRRRPTKRELLSIVMSIYDPIGFVAHFVLYSKILLQEVWTSGIGWDDDLTENQFEKFKVWMEALEFVKNVRVPRCYSIKIPKASSIQLHVFVDASQSAFCAVSYIRVETDEGVDISFVSAKTRVAPQKTLSVPRLELQGAVLGTRLSKLIQEDHDLKFDEIFYWCDSKTVLSWIRSDMRKYKQFVSHRVSEILSNSEVNEWHWVPTRINVADDATRSMKIPDMRSDSRWYKGPEFLQCRKSEWPNEDVKQLIDTNEEKLQNVHVHQKFEYIHENPDSEKFSKYTKLIRSKAWVRRFIEVCRFVIGKSATSLGGELTVIEVYKAELLLFEQVQWESYPNEMHLLSRGQEIPKSSYLRRYTVFLDNDGIMRMSGRIDAAKTTYDMKNPIILHHKHRITQLLIQYVHEKFKHQGTQTIINDLKQRFCIPKLYSAVKSIKAHCNQCKIDRAKPQAPQMAQLPVIRLTSNIQPFTYVGIDFFGPLYVTQGRNQVKRYGCLFTCMTIRAVHVELCNSLTTDSCIMAIRNFMNRRGLPVEILSDNATNFKGADREMREALERIDYDKIKLELTMKKIQWKFITPESPHTGGCWERLVQSIKKVLNKMFCEYAPKEETLRSFLIEAENIVNSRPLTRVPLEHEDDDVLTPNHFLVGSANGIRQPGEFSNIDLKLRKQWRISQQLTNEFWKKWVENYLPNLIRREKWYDKVPPLKVDDLVIIVDSKQPRNMWRRGKIVNVYPAKDGQVRTVDVLTSSGILKRSAVKVALLDVNNSN